MEQKLMLSPHYFNSHSTSRRGKRAELPEELVKKMKSCSVPDCEDWRDLNAKTTYHCFPKGESNRKRWEIWTALLRRAREDNEWMPFRGSLVCSHHFRTNDFVSDPSSKRTKISKRAVPSIFPKFTVDIDDPNSEYHLPSASYTYSTLYDQYNDNEYEDDQVEEEYEEVPEDEDIQSYANSTNAHKIIIYDDQTIRRERKQAASKVTRLLRTEELCVQENHSRSHTLNNNESFTIVQQQQPSTSHNTNHTKISRVSVDKKSLLLPYSLNPDLEIELVNPDSDPDTEDTHYFCHKRINEMEKELKTLRKRNSTLERENLALTQRMIEYNDVLQTINEARNASYKKRRQQ